MAKEQPEQQPIVAPTTVPLETLISLLAMILGTILLALGAGFAFGWPASLLVVGLVLLGFGFVLGLRK